MQKIFYGGDILTMVKEDDAPEAVWVKDGKIAYVGTREEAERLADAGAKRIDLQGKTLMPSFIDAHSHMAMFSQFSSFADLSGCGDFGDIVSALEQYIKKNRIGENGAVVACGYDHNFLKEEVHPTAKVLDRVSDTIPICLFHTSGHMAVANTPLLREAGISRKTKDPHGGRLGRDGSGEPDGYLEELPAVMPVLGKAFSRLDMDPVRQMEEVQNIYLKYGVTTVQDGGASGETVKEYLRLARQNLLHVDVVAYVLADGREIQALLREYPEAAGHYWHRFQIGGGKIVLDGSPQGKTAWLTRPYEGGEECGYPAHTDGEVEQAARDAIAGNYQLLAHCNGDAASDQYLRCYGKALEALGKPGKDLRPVMIHCQTVRDDQLDRMTELGMIPSLFVAHTYYWGDVHLKNLGPGRGGRISPVKSALERGLYYNFHQDSPVLKPDMMQTVWCAVNRVTRKGVKIGEEQCISVFDALKGVTVHAAYAYHEEDRKGTVEEGKLADFVILEANPLKTDKMALKDIGVEETIKEGVSLYRKKAAGAVRPFLTISVKEV